MIDQLAEGFYRNRERKFTPHKEEAFRKIDQFVSSIAFSTVENMNIDKDIKAACFEISNKVERKTIPQGEKKATLQGLGNNIVLLQIYAPSGDVSALWYMDCKTGNAMELVAGLSQFGIKLIAREETGGETGVHPFSHDAYNNRVAYVPGEKIDPSYFNGDDPLEIVATMSAAPAHEIGHTLSIQDKDFDKTSYWYDVSRDFRHQFSRKKLHRGSSPERMAMIAALKVANAANKHDIHFWRGYDSMEMMSRINKMLHW